MRCGGRAAAPRLAAAYRLVCGRGGVRGRRSEFSLPLSGVRDVRRRSAEYYTEKVREVCVLVRGGAAVCREGKRREPRRRGAASAARRRAESGRRAGEER